MNKVQPVIRPLIGYLNVGDKAAVMSHYSGCCHGDRLLPPCKRADEGRGGILISWRHGGFPCGFPSGSGSREHLVP